MNRKLDAQVAEHVMGWTEVTDRRTADGTWTGIRHDWHAPVVDEIPHYSTKIASAWEVVERMKERKRPLRLQHSLSGMWSAWLWPASSGESYGSTAPEAICLAALAACGKAFDL